MTMEKARWLQNNWNAKMGNTLCLHRRMVDTLTSEGRVTPQLLVCRECGAMIPDPVMKSEQNYLAKKAKPILACVS